MNDIDDVWGSDDSIIETQDSTNEAEVADIKRRQTKQGYLDGLVTSQESELQGGFDNAFPKGAELGVLVGQLLAEIHCYDEGRFKEAQKELNITNVLSRKYFDDDLEMNGHELIEKWQGILRELKR